jgi:hypothetical protein
MKVQLNRPLAAAWYPLAARPSQEQPARWRRGAMRKNTVTCASINQKTPARKLVYGLYQRPRGEQAVRFRCQPPNDVLVVAFKLLSQPGREPL